MSMQSTWTRYGLTDYPQFSDMIRILTQALKEKGGDFKITPSYPKDNQFVRFTFTPVEGVTCGNSHALRFKYVQTALRNMGMRNIAFRTITSCPDGTIKKKIDGYSLTFPIETNPSLKLSNGEKRMPMVRADIVEEILNCLEANPICTLDHLREEVSKSSGQQYEVSEFSGAIRHCTERNLIFAMEVEADTDTALGVTSVVYVVRMGTRVKTRPEPHKPAKMYKLCRVISKGALAHFLEDRSRSPAVKNRRKGLGENSGSGRRITAEREREFEARARGGGGS